MNLISLPLLVLLALPTLASAGNKVLDIEARADDYDVPSAIASYKLYDPNFTGSGTYSTGLMTNSQLGNSARMDATVLHFPAPYISLSGEAKGAPNRIGSMTLADYVGAEAFGVIGMGYQINVIGPGNLNVPLLIVGVSEGSLSGSGTGQIYAALSFNNLSASSVSSLGDTAMSTSTFLNPDRSLYFGASFTDSMTRSGDWSFHTSYQYAANVRSGTSFDINLVTMMDIYGGTGVGATADVSVDPLITIDPAWLSLHPGYSVQVEAGFGNALPVPEPETYTMLLAGLALLGVVARRRKLKTVTDCFRNDLTNDAGVKLPFCMEAGLS
jgi:hypothetical protein